MPSPSKAPSFNESRSPARTSTTGKPSAAFSKNLDSNVQKLVQVFETNAPEKRTHGFAFGVSHSGSFSDSCTMSPQAKKLRESFTASHSVTMSPGARKLRESIAAVIEKNATSNAANLGSSCPSDPADAEKAVQGSGLLKRCRRIVVASRGSLQRVLVAHNMWPRWLGKPQDDSASEITASESFACANGEYCFAHPSRVPKHSKPINSNKAKLCLGTGAKICQACGLWSLVRETGQVA